MKCKYCIYLKPSNKRPGRFFCSHPEGVGDFVYEDSDCIRKNH